MNKYNYEDQKKKNPHTRDLYFKRQAETNPTNLPAMLPNGAAVLLYDEATSCFETAKIKQAAKMLSE